MFLDQAGSPTLRKSSRPKGAHDFPPGKLCAINTRIYFIVIKEYFYYNEIKFVGWANG